MDLDFEFDLFYAFDNVVRLSDREEDELSTGNDGDVEETIFLEEFQEERHISTPEIYEQESSSFCILPDELIVNIFSYLTLGELCKRVALVCKLWLSFSRNALLWQKLSLEETKSFATLEELSNVIRRHCPFLKHLNLQPYHAEQNLTGWRVIAQCCPLLQSLSLSFCRQAIKEVITEFVTFCPKLCDIDLEGCVSVNDECLQVLEKLPLRKLNAAHCTHLTSDGLKFISRKCNQLNHLNFDGIQWITNAAIKVMVENSHGRLNHLWLDGENMADDTVEVIARCKNLQSFGLSFCDSLTDLSLMWIQSMKNLVTLKLTKGSEFSALALKELFEHLHPNRTGSATGLLHVNVAECASLDDSAIKALADSCRYLLTLNISWCWNVSDIGLGHVVTCCHKVVDLNVCGAKDLLGIPLKNIPQMIPSLRRLDATQCNLVPDELLEDLVSSMPHMTVIDYYGEEVKPRKFPLHNSAWGM